MIDPASSGDKWVRQDAYVRALVANNSIDKLVKGRFVENVKVSRLAVRGRRGRPQRVTSSWPIMVQDRNGGDVSDAGFMVSHANVEEKGSDVNLATLLTIDVYDQSVDAAIVLSNDSDLKLPVQLAKERVPVAVVNPSKNRLAGDLAGGASDGVGGHWWYQLDQADYTSSQLPDKVSAVHRPEGW